MKRVRWTTHALQALQDRHIDLRDVELTLDAPELISLDPPIRAVFMRRYLDRQLDQGILLRVVIEETPYERVIVTVYRTSQIARYLQD